MPDDPKPTPEPKTLDIKGWAAPVAMFALSAVLAWQQWRGTVVPTPAPLPPAPIVIEPTKFDYDRSFVLKDGKVLPKADAKPIIDAVNNGNATYTVRGFIEGKSEETRTVTISGGVNPVPPIPVPPEPPKPVIIPTGFAGDVYREAIKVNDPAGCKALAANYAMVQSKLAAGGLTTVEAAVMELTASNKALNLDKSKWTPFATWLQGEFATRAQSVPNATLALEQVAEGLQAAGGK